MDTVTAQPQIANPPSMMDNIDELDKLTSELTSMATSLSDCLFGTSLAEQSPDGGIGLPLRSAGDRIETLVYRCRAMRLQMNDIRQRLMGNAATNGETVVGIRDQARDLANHY